jgi:hypothetical protein
VCCTAQLTAPEGQALRTGAVVVEGQRAGVLGGAAMGAYELCKPLLMMNGRAVYSATHSGGGAQLHFFFASGYWLIADGKPGATHCTTAASNPILASASPERAHTPSQVRSGGWQVLDPLARGAVCQELAGAVMEAEVAVVEVLTQEEQQLPLARRAALRQERQREYEQRQEADRLRHQGLQQELREQRRAAACQIGGAAWVLAPGVRVRQRVEADVRAAAATAARQQEEEARGQALCAGDVVFHGLRKGEPQTEAMGVFELMEPLLLVNGRAVWWVAGGASGAGGSARYLYFASNSKWYIGVKEEHMRAGKASASALVASAAVEPDAVTPDQVKGGWTVAAASAANGSAAGRDNSGRPRLDRVSAPHAFVRRWTVEDKREAAKAAGFPAYWGSHRPTATAASSSRSAAWCGVGGAGAGFDLVALPPSADQYAATAELFHQTVKPEAFRILGIASVQHRHKWSLYALEREGMLRQAEPAGTAPGAGTGAGAASSAAAGTGAAAGAGAGAGAGGGSSCHGLSPCERLLFHGTARGSLEPILHQGFLRDYNTTSVYGMSGRASAERTHARAGI